ncbi:BrnT family toxin [Polynucleobacter sp. JS-Safj-400b-B2]|uniref:BrnT family toxin n=1 Tax=Polynucleobacter sp. JS-Safj-400b-B2 TaxID=2576921 RepID=UPI001C0B8EE4|nr:BrnT family toxin [Polynucleobacter sp. JS-Safj-400b-B2]MBU3627157.1 BrnT family toxin [Polynucleobacter sp. JS-Safj-400b-B2]
MEITYDLAKDAKNISERSLSFSRVADFDWVRATFREDARKDYPERRFLAVSYLDERLHVLCFSETDLGIRVISFRKANKREENAYEKAISADQ